MDTKYDLKLDEREDKKESKLTYKIIIIILIIILILLSFFICSLKRQQKKLLESSKIKINNKEIFDIKCDVNCKCNSGNQTNGSTLKVDVKDKAILWDKVNKISVFENPLYNKEAIIAPNSSNSYSFSIRNKTQNKVNYMVDFIEDNGAKINIKYRLKKGNKYLVGSKDEWVKADKLYIDEKDVEASSEVEYILDWKWFESDNDTKIGTTTPKYELHINIMAEQKV